MSWLSRAKKKAKSYGRKVLGVHSKASRVLRPVAAAAAGYFGGPAGAAAVTALTHYAHQYQSSSAARGDGIRGREARMVGRKESQRTTMHSIFAGGVGSLASGVSSALSGGSFFGGAAAGQGGAAILGGNTIFGGAAGAVGSTTAAISGAGSLGGLATAVTSLDGPSAPAGKPIEGAVNWQDLAEAVAAGAMGGLAGGSDDDSDNTTEEAKTRLGIPSFADSPSGSGGEKPEWLVPALVGLGALVFLS